jgi:hypothetical protein
MSCALNGQPTARPQPRCVRAPIALSYSLHRRTTCLAARQDVESLDRTQWKSWTYKQYLADVRKLARAMMAVGVEQFSYGAPRAAAGPLRICCPEQAPPASRTGRGSAVGASSPAHARALVYSDGCNGSSVGIWGFNSPEWFLADMATVFCGAKAAGIYPTDTPDQAPTRHFMTVRPS